MKKPGHGAGGGIEWGTIGWHSDSTIVHDFGSASDDGSNLVRVTLYRGRDPTTALDQSGSQAQGEEILCKLSSNFLLVPPKNTRVLVAIPSVGGMVPGGSMVIGADNPNASLLGTPSEGDIAVWSAIGSVILKLLASGTFSVSGQKIQLVSSDVELGPSPTDFVALAAKVNAELTKIATAFSTFLPGSGGASFPQPYDTAGDVSAQNVKAQ